MNPAQPSPTQWRRSERQVSSAVDGEFVLMGLHNSHYYGLKSSGSRIWELLEKPITTAQIVETLVDEYEVSPERCLADVEAFLKKLLDEALVTRLD